MEGAITSFWVLLLVLILSSGFLHLETIKFGLCSDTYNVSCIAGERNALLNLKQGLTDPSGRLSSWTGENCCSWPGVRCRDQSGHVTKLKLRNLYSSSPDVDGTAYALGGEIHPSLLHLKYLRYLVIN
ncbi:hypothetical protein SLA2020_328910 [Shorea laevis]